MARVSLLLLLPTNGAFAIPDFATEIKPIFERSCYSCHGPETQKNRYRLDVRDIALKGGNSGRAAIVPHDAANSPLMQYVRGDVEDMVMPPEKSGIARLTPDEIALLTAWIDAGPSWPDQLAGSAGDATPHWSLKPLVRPEVPYETPNPIDAFIRAKREENGIAPSPQADRRTLIRRVHYDLIGLPPAPEEVKSFMDDSDPAAYVKLVDRLLDSPRHGERWARHWLDTIHYADSHGYEHDVARENAWRFRDYVIAAFNNDTPWPRFIREQLAADVFYPDEPWLTPALGYLGAGTFDLSTYSTAPVTFEYLDRDDLVTQTAAAFFSTTANCARCHAHKFDPISQEDYYALQAVFAGVLKGDVGYDEQPDVSRKRRHWIKLHEAAIKRDASVLLAAEQEVVVRDWLAARGDGAAWTALDVETYTSAEGATLTRSTDGVIVSGGTRPDTDTYTLTATSTLPVITALRLDVVAHDSLPRKGPGRNDNGNFHLSEVVVQVFEPGAGQPRVVAMRRATADFNQDGWDISKAIDGDAKTAWGVDPAEGVSHHAAFEFAETLSLNPGTRLAITLRQSHGGGHVIGAFKLGATGDAPQRTVALPREVEDALAVAPEARTPEQRTAIAALAIGLAAQSELEALPPQSYVFAAAKRVKPPAGENAAQDRALDAPKVVNLLDRGDFDKPQDVVEPGALSALTHQPARFALANPDDESLRRAALADWIAHPENVLAWRSIVNRVWHYHFGRGICGTPSDFGEMGGTPSHPELIDWLAVWFRDDAQGSLNQLHRLIVTSETYMQASAHREDAAQVDGDNRLLWRQNVHRLDADAFRDYTLAISGRLDLTMGGPGIQHFTQGKGQQLTPALNYRAYDWNAPNAGRRSIYRFVWRGIADPFMEALDFPDLGLLSPVRGFSASSLQALALFNNDFVLTQSAALARRVESEAPDLASRVSRLVLLAWQREPTKEEHVAFTIFASTHGFDALSRVMLNTNEYLFVE